MIAFGEIMSESLKFTVESNLKTVKKEAVDVNTEMGKFKTHTLPKSANEAKEKSQDYGIVRSMSGTGAAGRDFAKQAAGLGGLVHVYATFAANLFAVSAAFTALKNAADTTNMVEGLNQLGAASGRNLGTLAKAMVAATDGAISLREAMTATAQASAAGMNSKDILRVAEGAKRASQALGIDMPDALSRLSRGITKLEPELLDELGIFVRVDRAAENYARTLGKPVSALTDVEKRAGFAIAALNQVEEKFGGIKIDSNPYTQILAALKDVATTGLTAINNVLGPLVGLLAKSPTALAVVLAGITATLIKQAIPALSQWRTGLVASAEAAAATATKLRQANEAYKESVYFKGVRALDAIAESQRKEALGLIVNNNLYDESSKTRIAAMTKEGIFSTTNAETIKGSITKINKEIDKLAPTILTANTIKEAKAIDLTVRKLQEKSAAYKELYETVNLQIKTHALAEKEFDSQDAKLSAESLKRFSAARRLLIAEEKAAQKSSAASILANVGNDAQVMGLKDTLKNLYTNTRKGLPKREVETIDREGNQVTKVLAATVPLNNVNKTITNIKGTAIAISSSIMSIASSLSNVFAVIGIGLTVFNVFSSWAKNNTKEVLATDNALKQLTESYEGLIRTMELQSKLSFLENLSASSITARSNALAEVSNSITTLIEKTEKEAYTRNIWDKLLNWAAFTVGEDTESNVAKSISKALLESIELVKRSPELQGMLPELLKLAGGKTTLDSLVKGMKDDPKLLKNVENGLVNVTKKAKEHAAANTAMSDSIKGLTKLRLEWLNTFASTDPFIKMGIGITATTAAMADALKDPIKHMGELVNISSELATSGIFTAEQTADLKSYSKVLESNVNSYRLNETAVIDLTDKINKSIAARKVLGTLSVDNKIGATDKSLLSSKDLEIAKADLAKAEAALAKNKEAIKDTSNLISSSVLSAFMAGSKITGLGIENAFTKSALSIQKAYAAGVSGTIGGSKQVADASIKEANLQLDQINTTIKLIAAIEDNTTSNELRSAREALASNEVRGVGRDKIRENVEILTTRMEVLGSKNPVATLTKILEDTLSKDSSGSNRYKALAAMMPDAEKRAQLNVRKAEAQAGVKVAKIGGEYASMDAENARAQKRLELTQATLSVEKSIINGLKDSGALTESQALQNTSNLEAKQRNLDFTKQENDLLLNISKAEKNLAANRGDKSAQQALSQRNEEYLQAWDTFMLNEKNAKLVEGTLSLKAAQNDSNKLYVSQQAIEYTQSRAILLNEETNIIIQQEKLNTLNEQGKVSSDVYIKSKASLDIAKEQVTAAQKRLDIEKDYQDKLRGFAQDRERSGPAASAEAQEELNQRIIAVIQSRTASLVAIDRETAATIRAAVASTEMSEKQKAYQSYFESSVSSMSDALVEFGFTGKQSFSDMIQSMIIDLAKLELRMALMSSFKSAGGFSGILGMLTGSNSDAKFESDWAAATRGLTQAKGGAWDSGVQTFAKGGAFTNSIVSSPTLFKFAKGMGLMGEAGPEAIMPLKRDANGRLGVSGGSETTVIVNNFSTAKAETKESIDSRGNRRIEVIVGDMVAGELQRSGSTAQQSLASTFGASPRLIRR